VFDDDYGWICDREELRTFWRHDQAVNERTLTQHPALLSSKGTSMLRVIFRALRWYRAAVIAKETEEEATTRQTFGGP
jgi:hypothetical protein